MSEHENVVFPVAVTIIVEKSLGQSFFFKQFVSLGSTVFETCHRINYSRINYENEKEDKASESIEILSSFAYVAK